MIKQSLNRQKIHCQEYKRFNGGRASDVIDIYDESRRGRQKAPMAQHIPPARSVVIYRVFIIRSDFINRTFLLISKYNSKAIINIEQAEICHFAKYFNSI